MSCYLSVHCLRTWWVHHTQVVLQQRLGDNVLQRDKKHNYSVTDHNEATGSYKCKQLCTQMTEAGNSVINRHGESWNNTRWWQLKQHDKKLVKDEMAQQKDKHKTNLTEPQNKLLLVNQGIPKDILYQIKKTLLEDTNGTQISANLYKLSECPCCSLLWTVCGRLKIIHTMF